MEFDYEYLCKGLGMLSGLQTRVYKGQELIFGYSYIDFQPDMVTLVKDKVYDCPGCAAYFDTPEFIIFGAVKVKKDNVTIVIGPTSQIKMTSKQVSDILLALGEPYSRSKELTTYLQNTPNFPLESFIQIICFLNYALNGEKLSVSDLIMRGISFSKPKAKQQTHFAEPTDEVQIHNTYEMEKTLMSLITAGNPDMLSKMFSEPPVGRVGKIAHDSLRQRKNTFICAATLASRAAVTGGLSTETAFSMSDVYIQKAELMHDYNELTRLNMDMLLDYARRVGQTKLSGGGSKLSVEVARYVNQNINRKVSVRDMAKAMDINRSYLGEQFKADTGLTLTEFITEQKIAEAKRLLKVTDQSASQISEYLCFSSQSYFQNVFKRIVGCTPKEFRDEGVYHT